LNINHTLPHITFTLSYIKFFSSIFLFAATDGGVPESFPGGGGAFRITFRLFTTFYQPWALRSKVQGWQNVPEQRRGNERSD
jgi:hypothetical protein